jgi:hypothetical protein
MKRFLLINIETFAKRLLLPPAIGGISGSNFNPPEADLSSKYTMYGCLGFIKSA